jgi:hypothetical protein
MLAEERGQVVISAHVGCGEEPVIISAQVGWGEEPGS